MLTVKTYTFSGTVTTGPTTCTSMTVELKLAGTLIKSVTVTAADCTFSAAFTYYEHATTTESFSLDIIAIEGFTSVPTTVAVTEPVTEYTA